MILNSSRYALSAKELTGNGTVTAEVSSAGTYYMYIKDAVGSSYYDDEYSITATYSSTTGARETESNDTLSDADLLIDGAA